MTGTPLERALRHGACADRLAWVFCAGYQAALAEGFPEFDGPGWSCLAASVREGATPCTFEHDEIGPRLDGEKSWIAAVNQVDRLVVAVGEGETRCFVHVTRGAEGLAFEDPGPASFLRELSQGRAHFDGVRPGAGAVLADPARARRFRGAEALFVLAALAARLEDQAAIDLARELSGSLDDRERIKSGVATLGAQLHGRAERCMEARPTGMPDALLASLRDDSKLLALYAPRR